jgi:sec-independent protein translocase protein TatC
MTDINQYLNFVIKLIFAFGIAFEIPVATFLLIKSKIVKKETLVKARPYLIIMFFVFGMLLTPPDIFSQLFLAIPMWVLFELGLLIAKDKS